jgi:hypothetical protein
MAADTGHLDCLKYAHEHGCPWDEETYSSAAYYGHLDCLMYAHKNGCPRNKEKCLRVAKGECKQYILDNYSSR